MDHSGDCNRLHRLEGKFSSLCNSDPLELSAIFSCSYRRSWTFWLPGPHWATACGIPSCTGCSTPSFDGSAARWCPTRFVGGLRLKSMKWFCFILAWLSDKWPLLAISPLALIDNHIAHRMPSPLVPPLWCLAKHKSSSKRFRGFRVAALSGGQKADRNT